MKLNFWQWLGLVLLLIGVALWIYKKSRPGDMKVEGRATLSPLHAAAAIPPVV
jgi:hypothetical protein